MAFSINVLMIVGAAMALLVLFHNVDGVVVQKKKPPPVCPDTVITPSQFEAMDIPQTECTLVRNILSSSMVQNEMTEEGKRFAEIASCVACETDSDKLRNTLFRTSFLISGFLPTTNPVRLCLYTTLINATLAYEKNKKHCDKLAFAFRNTFSQVENVCQLIGRAGFCDMGCHPNETVITLPGGCQGPGLDMDMEEVLLIFGKNLPCNLRDSLLKLSKSKDRSDRSIAVIYAAIVVSNYVSVPVPLIYEVVNITLEGKAFAHCCHQRTKRINDACIEMHTNINSNLDDAINSICHNY